MRSRGLTTCLIIALASGCAHAPDTADPEREPAPAPAAASEIGAVRQHLGDDRTRERGLVQLGRPPTARIASVGDEVARSLRDAQVGLEVVAHATEAEVALRTLDDVEKALMKVRAELWQELQDGRSRAPVDLRSVEAAPVGTFFQVKASPF